MAKHGSVQVPLEVADDASSPTGVALPVIDRGTRDAIEAMITALNGQVTPVFVHRVAHAAIGGHRLVCPRSADGELEYADNDLSSQIAAPVWLTTGAWNTNDLATVVALGLVSEPSWTWTPNLALFVGDNGVITQTVPALPTATYMKRIGSAIDATTIFFNPSPTIVL